jgi:xanthine/CO dehydrogenase XdhC/CoxF family maturation factor
VDILLESIASPAVQQQLRFIETCWQERLTGAIATIFHVQAGSAHSAPSHQAPETAPFATVQPGDRVYLTASQISHPQSNPDLAEMLSHDLTTTLAVGKTHTQRYPLERGTDDGSVEALIEVVQPPVPLIIFGAGYDAIPVVQFAKQLGWHVTVVDHRAAYLHRDRFPLADALICCTPDQLAERIKLQTNTVVVIMTHHFLRDLALLEHLFAVPLAYIGLLGAKARTAKLLQALQEQGCLLSPETLQHFYSPIGLDLGSETPVEIALAIVAEIQAVLAQRQTQSLGPHHLTMTPAAPGTPVQPQHVWQTLA